MSLVNDMLRDLEQRSEKPTQVPGNTPQVKAAQYVEEPETPALSPSRIALWLIGLVAIGATLWLLWQDYSKKQATEPLLIKAEEISPDKSVTEEKEAITVLVSKDRASNSEAQPVNVANADNIDKPIAIPETVTSERVSINKVRWSGTDIGGDLVVTLDGVADIQLLSQDERVITVSFDNVSLKTAPPTISSPLIQRLDVSRDDERTLLTLTAAQASKFAFRVQQSPTTLILGVLPDQRFISRQETTAQEVAKVPEDIQNKVALVSPAPVSEPSVNAGGSPAGTGSDKSSGLQEIKPEPKPVTKAKRELSDQQVAAKARKLLKQGGVDTAEKLLRNRIIKHPKTSAEVRSLLATLLLSRGELREGRGVVMSGLNLHPQNTDLRKLQSRLWISEGKSDQVVSILQQNTPDLVKDPEYFELLASAYQQSGNYERSAKTYYQLLQHSREVPRWWVGMGYALEQSQHYSEARNAYLSALKVVGIEPGLKSYAEQRVKALLGR